MREMIAALCGGLLVLISGGVSWLLVTAMSTSRVRALELENRALRRRVSEMKSLETVATSIREMEAQADRLGQGQAKVDESLVNLVKIITGEMALATPGGTHLGQNTSAGLRQRYEEADPQAGLPDGIAEPV